MTNKAQVVNATATPSHGVSQLLSSNISVASGAHSAHSQISDFHLPNSCSSYLDPSLPIDMNSSMLAATHPMKPRTSLNPSYSHTPSMTKLDEAYAPVISSNTITDSAHLSFKSFGTNMQSDSHLTRIYMPSLSSTTTTSTSDHYTTNNFSQPQQSPNSLAIPTPVRFLSDTHLKSGHGAYDVNVNSSLSSSYWSHERGLNLQQSMFPPQAEKHFATFISPAVLSSFPLNKPGLIAPASAASSPRPPIHLRFSTDGSEEGRSISSLPALSKIESPDSSPVPSQFTTPSSGQQPVPEDEAIRASPFGLNQLNKHLASTHPLYHDSPELHHMTISMSPIVSHSNSICHPSLTEFPPLKHLQPYELFEGDTKTIFQASSLSSSSEPPRLQALLTAVNITLPNTT